MLRRNQVTGNRHQMRHQMDLPHIKSSMKKALGLPQSELIPLPPAHDLNTQRINYLP